MAPPDTHTETNLLLIYRPQRDERLSWPSWLTYSRPFTHCLTPVLVCHFVYHSKSVYSDSVAMSAL